MPADAPHATDFDFQIGAWTVRHRRLRDRLVGSNVWDSFDGTSVMRPVLGGNGNIEDNLLDFPGAPYRAIAVRSFDPASETWAIWWLDARTPHALDVPVIGTFAAGVGSFHAETTLNGAPTQVRFLWLQTNTSSPRWEQAFSIDRGIIWETNWTMDFTRA